jgi:hypothetical protein
MLLYGTNAIGRTRWRETTASTQQRRYSNFVGLQHQDDGTREKPQACLHRHHCHRLKPVPFVALYHTHALPYSRMPAFTARAISSFSTSCLLTSRIFFLPISMMSYSPVNFDLLIRNASLKRRLARDLSGDRRNVLLLVTTPKRSAASSPERSHMTIKVPTYRLPCPKASLKTEDLTTRELRGNPLPGIVDLLVVDMMPSDCPESSLRLPRSPWKKSLSRSYALSLARPFARRRAIIALPPTEAILARKPILRFRFLFDG